MGWGLPYGNMIATDTAKLVMESAVQVALSNSLIFSFSS